LKLQCLHLISLTIAVVPLTLAATDSSGRLRELFDLPAATELACRDVAERTLTPELCEERIGRVEEVPVLNELARQSADRRRRTKQSLGGAHQQPSKTD
jgi:hypothetical protein